MIWTGAKLVPKNQRRHLSWACVIFTRSDVTEVQGMGLSVNF